MNPTNLQRTVMRQLPVWLGIALFAAIVWTSEHLVEFQSRSVNVTRSLEVRNELYAVREKIDRSLGAIIHRSTGVIAYIQSKSGVLEPQDVAALLEALYSSSLHVRNFGLAEGTVIRYMYPVEGNRQALGMDYRTVPDQWPSVLAAMNSDVGMLTGPLELVQGGTALIYRVPVRVDAEYWGMLSTVIDLEAYLQDTVGIISLDGRLAIRARQADEQVSLVYGDSVVFTQASVQRVDVGVPGAKWEMAFAPSERDDEQHLTLWRIAGLVLGMLSGLGLATILVQRRALQQLALIDGLTGIANRRQFDLMLEKFCQKYQRRNSGCFALLYIDLDRFKALNDQHGHKAGDYFLVELAKRAAHAVRGSDVLARWGGDEFAIILDNPTQASIEHVVDRVRTLCEQPVRWRGLELQVGASIGVVQYPQDGTNADALVGVADKKMYENKEVRQT